MVHTVLDGTFRQTNLTNESSEYLAKREELRLAEIELMRQRERVAELRRHLPEGAPLLLTVEALIRTSAAQANAHHEQAAPGWIPRNGKDSSGIPYVVVTCTECLRSFPLNVVEEANPEVMETPCYFCGTGVRYIVDFSVFVVSPPKRPAVTHARLEHAGGGDSAPEWSKKAEA